MKIKLLVLVAALCVGCEDGIQRTERMVPTGATNVIHMGNSWYVFELDNRKYLYRKYDRGEWTTVPEITNSLVLADIDREALWDYLLNFR